MSRVSRNLSMLRDNHDELREASDLRNRRGQAKLNAQHVDLLVFLDWFRTNAILARQDRSLLTAFKVTVPKDTSEAKKLARLHGNVEQRALEACVSDFLPKFLKTLREEEGEEPRKDESDSEENEEDSDIEGLVLDREDPEVDAGLLSDDDED